MTARFRTLAATGALLLLCGTTEVLRRQLTTFRIRGESMRPTLEPGDVVLGYRIGSGPLATVSSIGVGDVVLARTPWEPERPSVKRAVAGPGEVWLDGDDSVAEGPGWVLVGDERTLSTDSRHHGRVPEDALEAAALWILEPRSRRGRIPDAPPLQAWAAPSAPSPKGHDH